jgi:hypothetical protein
MPYSDSLHRMLRVVEPPISFHVNPNDSTRIQVNSINPDGSKETIGAIFMEYNGSETIYHATDKDGDEIFIPENDFSSIESQFDMYAKRLHAFDDNIEVNNQSLQNNLTLKNLNQMKNSNQNQTKSEKINQVIFVEYQFTTKDGHLVSVTDSYRNPLGRIYRSYNEQTQKYEFSACDHAGKPIGQKTEKLWELKKVFTDNSKQLLEDAHQRRIESKKLSKEATASDNVQPEQVKQQDDREQGLQDLRTGESHKSRSSLER